MTGWGLGSGKVSGWEGGLGSDTGGPGAGEVTGWELAGERLGGVGCCEAADGELEGCKEAIWELDDEGF